MQAKSFELVLKVNFIDGCGCQSVEINIPIDFKVRRGTSSTYFMCVISFIQDVNFVICTSILRSPFVPLIWGEDVTFMPELIRSSLTCLFHLLDKTMAHDTEGSLQCLFGIDLLSGCSFL